MLRLFIAIPIEGEIKWRLESSLAPLYQKSLGAEVRFVESNLWHLTLVFLGDQDVECVARCKSAIDEAYTHIEFERLIYFKELVWKSNEKGGGMIWAVFQENSDSEIKNIKKSLTEKLQKHGVFWHKDNRAGREHLTLARIKYGAGIKLDKCEDLKDLSFAINKISLFESTLTIKGPIYHEL